MGGGFIAQGRYYSTQQSDPENFTIMQGYLEQSNVSAIEEMISLIEVSRAHEANQKMIQTFDQNIGKAIGTLGRQLTNMNLSLYSGATGMQAQQLNLNVISNNIANVNTTGFKKNKIEFQDLLYQNPRQSGGQTGAGNVIPTGVEMGNGTKVVSTAKIFTQGQLTQTSEKMDMAIDGVGFFQVERPDGTEAYTRDGALKWDLMDKYIADALPLAAGLQIDPEVTNVLFLLRASFCGNC